MVCFIAATDEKNNKRLNRNIGNNLYMRDNLIGADGEKMFSKATKTGLQSFISNNKDKYDISIEELTNRVNNEKSDNETKTVQETKKYNDYNGQEDW